MDREIFNPSRKSFQLFLPLPAYPSKISSLPRWQEGQFSVPHFLGLVILNGSALEESAVVVSPVSPIPTLRKKSVSRAAGERL